MDDHELEPHAANNVWISLAISAKRIADALERMAANEAGKPLTMHVRLNDSQTAWEITDFHEPCGREMDLAIRQRAKPAPGHLP